MANPCEWNGTRYRSRAAVARAAGTTELAVRLYIARHGTLEGFGDPPAMSEQSVRHLLACGYGVEDIADKLHVDPDAVRGVVDDLRAAVLAADGDLDAFIGEGSQKFMKGAASQNTGAFDWQDEQQEGQEDEQG